MNFFSLCIRFSQVQVQEQKGHRAQQNNIVHSIRRWHPASLSGRNSGQGSKNLVIESLEMGRGDKSIYASQRLFVKKCGSV